MASSRSSLGTPGSTTLDGFARDLRYAVRNLLRTPLTAVTIVATLALGLGLVAAVYTALNAMIFRVDEVRNPYELFGIERPQAGREAEPETFTRAEYETLLRETDVFTAAFASTSDVTAWIDGARREGRLVTGNFFDVLGVGAARGRALTPADDEPGQPPVIVLSHRAWVQHYASNPAVLDAAFRVNGTLFRIVGVMPDGFRGLDVVAAPDFWAPVALLEVFRQQRAGEGSIDGLGVVGRIRPGMSADEGAARLAAWDSQRSLERASERPTGLVLAPRLGTLPQPIDAILAFMPLFFAFGLILMIGCANVANLLLARSVARQREIGIRLAIGASRGRVVLQLLTESLLLALLAAALAFGLSRAVLSGIVYALTTSFPPEIGNLRLDVPPADWRVALFLLLAALAATALFALAPALRATHLQVTRVIHGEALGAGRPDRARNALVALQVTASVLLLVCAAIFLRSAWAAATRDPGVRTADIVNVSVLDEAKRGAILDTVRSDPTIAAVAASWPGFLGGLIGVPAYGEGASDRSVVSYQFVSPEFFDVLGLDVVRGRGFAATERSPNEAVALVSESVARELWPDGEALGQVLRLEPDPTIGRPASAPPPAAAPSDEPLLRARSAVVIGVTRDIAGFTVGGIRLAGTGVYLPVDAAATGTALITRVRGDLTRARNGLVDRLAASDPNMAEVSTLETLTRTDTYILGTSFWLTLVLGTLALLLTLTGLFGVLSYLVEQRTREIGVRMALGASGRSIGGLVLMQSARPVGIGILLGCTLTLGLGAALLATPFAEPIAATVRLFDPVAYGGSLLAIVAACAGAALIPALRASAVNPLAALRQD